MTQANTNPKPNIIQSNVIGYGQRHPLDALFAPNKIAVIGATGRSGSVGRMVLENLLNSPFKEKVFPVNPRHSTILDVKSYPDLKSLPGPVDLAIIITPARIVPDTMTECVEAGVKGAIILSAGFKESGSQGAELERQVLEIASQGNIRLLGPNCMGLMRPQIGLNATFASPLARPGKVAFISQSGALCSAVLDWSFRENVGFSAFISIGSMADIGWGDLISYLGDDFDTRSIVIYMETVGEARAFLSAAREVALSKPIIVIKPGRTQAAARAAASHTGTLVGSDEVLEAAFRRCGVMRVNTIGELFNMAEVLALQPRPRGSRLAILTNAGGPGVLATDTLISGGGELASLSAESVAALNQFLPPHWSHNNPVDIIGDATPDRYAKAMEVLTKDPNTDGLLVIMTPQAMTDPTQTAREIARFANTSRPVLASWMGGTSIEEGQSLLSQASIPTYPFPDTATRVFNNLWRYNYNLKALYETPAMPVAAEDEAELRAQVSGMIETARQAGRTVLTELESKQIMEAYGIPSVETYLVNDQEEAVTQAEELGYPVVLKLHSYSLLHKSDVGGVQLNLNSAEQVRKAYQTIQASVTEKAGAEHFQGVTVQPMIKLDEAYELILGSSLDEQFGPVLLFGSGGQLVEVYQDHILGLPPLNTTLARRMMEQTKVYTALQGVRGRQPVDLAALEQLMVQFSRLVVEQRFIKEIDINPLLASADQLLALDARVILYEAGVTRDQLPRLAIRPYPNRYVQSWNMRDGSPVTLRPIRPEDEPLVVKFHETLSERSVFFRYLHMLGLSQRTAHERLTRICFIDYDREIALVAAYESPETGQSEILGVGRLIKLHGKNEAEFAVLVSDQWQGQGLGIELVRRLLQIGRDEKLDRIVGDIHPENQAMQAICRKLGFKSHYSFEDQVVKVHVDL